MATGFGVGPDANGNGTTPEDIQRINGAEYASPGIISGAKVSGSATMSYNVSAGAVVLDTATGMAVKVPVVATTVPTIAAPGVGSRTDTIYVKQNFPGSDGASNATVGISHDGNIPANSIVLDSFVVGAGITATSAATSNSNRRFAVPVSGSLGQLFTSTDTNGMAHAATVTFSRGSGKFTLSEDRFVQFSLLTAMAIARSDGTTPPVDWRATVTFGLVVDGVQVVTHEREISRLHTSDYFPYTMRLSEGTHTVRYDVIDTWFPTTAPASEKFWALKHGGANQRSGNVFTVEDKGIVSW